MSTSQDMLPAPAPTLRWPLQSHLWQETHYPDCWHCQSIQPFGYWEGPDPGTGHHADIYAQCQNCGSFSKSFWKENELIPAYLNLVPLA